MTFYEQELRKIIGEQYPDATYVGRACYVRLSDMNRAKIQFATGIVANQYNALQMTILNRSEGQVDTLRLRFSDLLGTKATSNPNFRNGVDPHIWDDYGKVDWYVYQVVGFLGNFFAEMGNMGVELFEMSWVQSIVLFFSYLAWALYGTGLVVACFECGIEYSSGRGNIRETALNAIKGFMAVSLFTVVPVRLYELSVTLQGQLTAGITDYGASIGDVASDIMQEFSAVESLTDLTSGPFLGFGSITSGIMILFCIILMAYAIIKVFFANLKRGGILLIQIAVGSLYMFSVPRGYTDGFIQWCKQIIGLCLTAFLQATILIAGLMVFKDHALLGLGLMLSAGEIPRIAGAFGLDTTTRANIMSAVYTAQAAVNTTRTIVQAVSK